MTSLPKMVIRVLSGLPDFDDVSPTWVAAYDVEAFDGKGMVELTNDPAKALRFDGLAAAFAAWQSSPKCHPVRLTDGRPNRPLTAYTVSIEPAP